MKKVLCLLACAVFALFSGVLLCACDSSKYLISISFDEPLLGYATVEVDGREAQANLDGKYEAFGNSQVTINLFANEYGTDTSGVEAKLNGKPYEIEKSINVNYDEFNEKDGDLKFGYIKFGAMEKNANIVVSGLKGVENKLTFVEAENQDEAAKERMAKAYIKLPNEADFINFADFMEGDRTMTFNLLGQSSFNCTFQMKFMDKVEDKEIPLGNPYELSTEKPFQIMENNQPNELARISYSDYDGIYTFDLGNLKSKTDLEIEVDFASLKCRDFDVNLGSNQMYEVKLNSGKSTINVETEDVISVKKLSDDITIDEENVKAYLNDLELQKVEPQEELEEGTINFAVPKWLTPKRTGGQDVFNFRLDGVSFIKVTHTLSAQTKEAHPVHLINPQFDTIDGESGEKQGIVGYDQNGNIITFEDKTNILTWQYEAVRYGEKSYYITPYDLYDYDVVLNGEVLFNVKSILTDGAHQAEFEAGSEITHNFEEKGTTFKATYNQSTEKYDAFELQFNATTDMAFTFENFKSFTKQVAICYDFDDLRLQIPFPDGHTEQIVEYTIGQNDSSEREWHSLQKGVPTEAQDVEFGDVIFFRLQINQDIGENEFRLQDTIASNSFLNSEDVVENGIRYLILKFNISDIHFETVENVKLVPNYMV